MDHGQYCRPEFTAGNPNPNPDPDPDPNPNTTLHFHSSLVSQVPFYMHQVLNPNAPSPLPPHSSTVSPPALPPPLLKYSAPTGWDDDFHCRGSGSGINLNHGTNRYAPSTSVRWPRQETLTLLEIRSRLDPCFKEATSSTHKAPLWDEISRIMNDEYGYQRSGRKCKEKFENLYKYYKKTKEGKVGKHDGKHYRFFRQLEALFQDQPNLRSTSSLSNHSSEYETPLSDHQKNGTTAHELAKKEVIMATIEESIESHLAKLMVRQDEWGERILCAIEHKDQTRIIVEEEWRKQEAARLDQEYEAWANHVARIETRDRSLLDALQNLSRVRSLGFGHGNVEPMANSKETRCPSDLDKRKDWAEPELSSLIHIRTGMECRFQDADQKHHERLWEEVAFELSRVGYDRSESDCKETWEKIFVHFNKTAMEFENTSKEVSSRTSNDPNRCFGATAINIDGERSWETM